MINSVTGNSDLDSPKQIEILRPSQNSGGSRVSLPAPSPPPLIFDQTEARRAEKIFWGDLFLISGQNL